MKEDHTMIAKKEELQSTVADKRTLSDHGPSALSSKQRGPEGKLMPHLDECVVQHLFGFLKVEDDYDSLCLVSKAWNRMAHASLPIPLYKMTRLMETHPKRRPRQVAEDPVLDEFVGKVLQEAFRNLADPDSPLRLKKGESEPLLKPHFHLVIQQFVRHFQAKEFYNYGCLFLQNLAKKTVCQFLELSETETDLEGMVKAWDDWVAFTELVTSISGFCDFMAPDGIPSSIKTHAHKMLVHFTKKVLNNEDNCQKLDHFAYKRCMIVGGKGCRELLYRAYKACEMSRTYPWPDGLPLQDLAETVADAIRSELLRRFGTLDDPSPDMGEDMTFSVLTKGGKTFSISKLSTGSSLFSASGFFQAMCLRDGDSIKLDIEPKLFQLALDFYDASVHTDLNIFFQLGQNSSLDQVMETMVLGGDAIQTANSILSGVSVEELHSLCSLAHLLELTVLFSTTEATIMTRSMEGLFSAFASDVFGVAGNQG